jgi:hypothetical protein
MGTASAVESVAVVKLEAPLTAKQKIIADHAVWICEADSCVAHVSNELTAQGCTAISKKVGRLVSYGAARKPFTPEQMEACNAGAPATVQAAK